METAPVEGLGAVMRWEEEEQDEHVGKGPAV